jgi:hypothetical protein
MVGDVDGLRLYPDAFVVLVLGKSYHVAKSALVPTVVHSDDELVEANSKLSLLSGVVGLAIAIPGGIALKLVGAEATLVLAVAVFSIGAALAFKLPPTQSATSCEDSASGSPRRRWACSAASSDS